MKRGGRSARERTIRSASPPPAVEIPRQDAPDAAGAPGGPSPRPGGAEWDGNRRCDHCGGLVVLSRPGAATTLFARCNRCGRRNRYDFETKTWGRE
jgi:hypothetical protein